MLWSVFSAFQDSYYTTQVVANYRTASDARSARQRSRRNAHLYAASPDKDRSRRVDQFWIILFPLARSELVEWFAKYASASFLFVVFVCVRSLPDQQLRTTFCVCCSFKCVSIFHTLLARITQLRLEIDSNFTLVVRFVRLSVCLFDCLSASNSQLTPNAANGIEMSFGLAHLACILFLGADMDAPTSLNEMKSSEAERNETENKPANTK